MIAQILSPGGERNVYIPEGEWVDFHTKEVINGPKWIRINVPLSIVPIYVKRGLKIPMLTTDVKNTGEITSDKIVMVEF